MVCQSRPYHFKFFKGCLPQILLGPFLNNLIPLFRELFRTDNNLDEAIFRAIFNIRRQPEEWYEAGSVHASASPSRHFLGIWSLFFSKFWHCAGNPYDFAGFLDFAKFFDFLEKLGKLFSLNLFYNESLYYLSFPCTNPLFGKNLVPDI